jgi:Zn-dependent protease
MTTHRLQIFIFSGLGVLLIGLSGWLVIYFLQPATPFDGGRAYQDVLAQVSLGARTPGSVAHAETIAYIQQELEKAGWKVQIQATE